MAELVIVRGLPGSGKSTLARGMVGFEHIEADMYFIDPDTGEYCFNHAEVGRAHDWCQKMTKKALADGRSVVVSNTFTMAWEMKPYFDMGYPVRVITCKGRWQNVHGVPPEVITRMAERWEPVEMVDYI